MEVLRRYSHGIYDILVPDLFWVEIANFLWKAARTGRCTSDEARLGLGTVQEYNFQTLPSASLVLRAFEIASRHRQTVYDCLYVALAEQVGAELITADAKLANALAARYPVKLLSIV
jgi:predicted nucleic acid-binding protein